MVKNRNKDGGTHHAAFFQKSAQHHVSPRTEAKVEERSSEHASLSSGHIKIGDNYYIQSVMSSHSTALTSWWAPRKEKMQRLRMERFPLEALHRGGPRHLTEKQTAGKLRGPGGAPASAPSRTSHVLWGNDRTRLARALLIWRVQASLSHSLSNSTSSACNEPAGEEL